jgi:hypothetical protein
MNVNLTDNTTGQTSTLSYDTAFVTSTEDDVAAYFQGRIVFTADGTFTLRFRRTAGSGNARVKSASMLSAQREV